MRLCGAAPDIIPIGVASDENIFRRSTNPILGYELKPGTRRSDVNVPVHYRQVNAHGLRDIERSFEKRGNVKRIILLGDSVALGYGMGDMSKLMSRQLEKMFGEQQVEVLNLSVTGYCTRAEVELLKTKGLKFKPDLVVLLFVENDFRNFNIEAFGADGISSRPAIVSWLFRNCHTFRLTCSTFNWFNYGLEEDPATWNQRAIGDNNVVEGLKLFRAMAEEHAFSPILAVWPTFTNDGIDYAEKMFVPGSRDLIVESIASSFGLPTVGLREPFLAHWRSQDPRPNPRIYYTIGDEMHASAAGHGVAAEILYDAIGDMKLLGSAQTPLQPLAEGSSKTAIEAASELGTQRADYGMVRINEAIKLQREGRLDEAIAKIESFALADSVHSNLARCLLADFLERQGKYQRATELLRQVLAEDANNSQAHFLLAGIQNSQKNSEQAIHHLKKTIELRPEHFPANSNLGMMMMSTKNWEEAAKYLRRASQLSPRNVQISNLLARAQVRLGKYAEAARQFQHTLKVSPQNREANRELNRLRTYIER